MKHLTRIAMACALTLGCQQPTASTFFKRAIPAIQSSLSFAQSVYIPAYAEKGFPAPNGVYRRMTLSPRWMETIDSVATKDSVVALTFDACSTLHPPRADTSVIYQLLRSKTPATFFLGGRWVEAFPELTRKIAGTSFFEIANHSYVHGHLTKVSPKRRRWEIRYTQDIIAWTTGITPRFFRAPYLESDSAVAATVAAEGLCMVAGVATGDPDSMMTAARLVQRVSKLARPGRIFIMHTNRGGWHTAEALPSIIAQLQRKGYRLVTMSELVARH